MRLTPIILVGDGGQKSFAISSKGIYDTKPPHQSILVTGSARLEIFNQIGDSLAGRYFLHRLLPLSPSECYKVHEPYTIDQFLERGGFPEPFLAENNVDADRWRLQYIESLLNVDVLDFEATCLLKHVYEKVDKLGQRYELAYLQTKEKKEVDFALIREGEIESMIEVKYANAAISPGLIYFKEKYSIPGIQIVKELKRERLDEGIKILKADSYLRSL